MAIYFDSSPAESFGSMKSHHIQITKGEIVKQEIRKCEQLSFGAPPTFHPGGKIGGSKTIASFDVGLFNKAGDLECQPSIEVTKQKLLPIIGAFYGRSATA